MGATYTAFAGFLVCLFGAALLFWQRYFAADWPSLKVDSHRLSWAVLWGFMIPKTVTLQVRTDVSALITEGLSTQNRVQVVVAFT